MSDFIIFGGTYEGRQLAKEFLKRGSSFVICVATEYGEYVLKQEDYQLKDHIHTGRIDEEEIKKLIHRESGKVIIDATHPYADKITQSLQKIADELDLPYLRLLRKESLYKQVVEEEFEQNQLIEVANTEEAIDYLNRTTGKVLLTTGSKELAKFVNAIDFRERYVARVLPSVDVLKQCEELGIPGANLVCMQGPFKTEFNIALINQIGAEYLVTKESGGPGGFDEKLKACVETGTKVILIKRPLEEFGDSLEKIVQKAESFLATGYLKEMNEKEASQKKAEEKENLENPIKNITLLGIGMGSTASMTKEGIDALINAEVIIGAKRITDTMCENDYFNPVDTQVFTSYDGNEIRDFISKSDKNKFLIGLSGDSGFYSGAKKIRESLEKDEEKDWSTWNITTLPGISTLAYLAAKAELPWEDIKISSLHGKKEFFIPMIERYKKVFYLLEPKFGIQEVCKKLVEYGMEDVNIWLGEQLSYPEEKVTFGHPSDFLDFQMENLGAIIVENPNYRSNQLAGIPDEDFIRGKVPMTKEEIRTISVSKLFQYTNQAEELVVYDVGAGTGSVAIEIARKFPKAEIYAIEKNHEGIELIQKNKLRFKCDNIKVVEGVAPEKLQDLPVPTHAFIGGSSGNLKDIFQLLFEKNPKVRVVVNAISLETIAETFRELEHLEIDEVDITQLMISKSKTLGRYHMMTGQNPVLIFSFSGKVDSQ